MAHGGSRTEKPSNGGDDHGDMAHGGVAEQIPRPSRPGPPPRHRADRRPVTSRRANPPAQTTDKESISNSAPGVRDADPSTRTVPARRKTLARVSGPPTRPGVSAAPVPASGTYRDQHGRRKCALAGAQLCLPTPPAGQRGTMSAWLSLDRVCLSRSQTWGFRQVWDVGRVRLHPAGSAAELVIAADAQLPTAAPPVWHNLIAEKVAAQTAPRPPTPDKDGLRPTAVQIGPGRRWLRSAPPLQQLPLLGRRPRATPAIRSGKVIRFADPSQLQSVIKHCRSITHTRPVGSRSCTFAPPPEAGRASAFTTAAITWRWSVDN